MACRGYLKVAAVGALALAMAGCGRNEAPANTPEPATAAQQPAEPVFKPIDPSALPVVPQSGPNTATFPPASLPGGGSAEPTAMVTDMASGWPVSLRVGQTMTARLTLDGAGGARWSLRPGSDAGVVTVGAPTTDTPAGQPPVEVFRVTAARAGQATLTFDLKAGAAGAPARSVSYPVTVQ